MYKNAFCGYFVRYFIVFEAFIGFLTKKEALLSAGLL